MVASDWPRLTTQTFATSDDIKFCFRRFAIGKPLLERAVCGRAHGCFCGEHRELFGFVAPLEEMLCSPMQPATGGRCFLRAFNGRQVHQFVGVDLSRSLFASGSGVS
jgi:hypothetical protein